MTGSPALSSSQDLNPIKSDSKNGTPQSTKKREVWAIEASSDDELLIPRWSAAKRYKSDGTPLSDRTLTAGETVQLSPSGTEPGVVIERRRTSLKRSASSISRLEDETVLAVEKIRPSERSIARVFSSRHPHKKLRPLPSSGLFHCAQPPLKRYKLPPAFTDARPDPERLHLPESSLFFSPSPGERPPLIPRFTSADATIMLKKTDQEDSAGLRSLKMARGAVQTPNQIPLLKSTTSTSSPRMSLQRRITGKSSSLSPEEAETLQSGLQTLNTLGIVELLEQDDRPTLVIDLTVKQNFAPGPLQPTFVNNVLSGMESVLDLVLGHTTAPASGIRIEVTFTEFKAWLTSFVRNNESLDVSLPAFQFCGLTWSCSTIRRRFRVLNGKSDSNNNTLIPGSLGLLTTSSNGTKGSVSHETTPREVHGYFDQVKSKDLEDWTAKKDALHSPIREVFADKQQPSIADLAEIANTPDDDDPYGTDAVLRAVAAAKLGESTEKQSAQGCFDWTKLSVNASLPKHIQFARSIDWASTSLGPIEEWGLAFRVMVNLVMASPHPSAVYWGKDMVAMYNEAYILLAGEKHPSLMGTPYAEGWKEIWSEIKSTFEAAIYDGQSTMKDDDRLFIYRSGYLEETYFSWSIIPLVGDDGTVQGLYNPAFEKTRRKIAERRMLTLREVGDKTAMVREVKYFWKTVLEALEYNEYDTPFVLLYSVAGDQSGSEGSTSELSGDPNHAKTCTLEGTLPALPSDHPAAVPTLDLRTSTEGFANIFRDALYTDKPVLLETNNGTLDPDLIADMEWRGFGEMPRSAVVCPIHPTTGDNIIGFLVMGVNPRRPYDDDYNLFVQLLTRVLATSMASVVLFEEEIRRGQRAAKAAALDRMELSEQLAIRTKEAVESETKFTRMAEFAPVGMFIADSSGRVKFTNDAFHTIARAPAGQTPEQWIENVVDEDKPKLRTLMHDVVEQHRTNSIEIRFKTMDMTDPENPRSTWALCSVFPEKDEDLNLKSIFGSITDITQQKWAEELQKKRTEEAIELKRQQSNFIDMTSHEMRNPLSAIVQCADEVVRTLTQIKAQAQGGKNFTIPLDVLENNLDAAQTITFCANHQTRIISDVLTMSKMDSALLHVTPVPINPKEIVEQAMKMFDGEMQTADIRTIFKIDPALDELKVEYVKLDPSRLLQVLINLTTNAIKFTTTQETRTITINLTASRTPPSENIRSLVKYIPARARRKDVTDAKEWGDGEIVYLGFAVTDTGKGLTEEEKKNLFLRFSQASAKTHVQYGGSGLGLFISRELVELQGGEIGVSSESGKGSTFAFYVKAKRCPAPESKEVVADPSGAGRKSSLNRSEKSLDLDRKDVLNESKIGTSATTMSGTRDLSHLNVLVVEDNLVNQKVLTKQLRSLGCHVAVANHGEECLAHLRKTKYWKGNGEGLDLSVILMDQEMPVMDGLTCTREIRRLQEVGDVQGHVPIIAVTANARSAQIDTALEAGMDDVVSKPFKVLDMIPKVEYLLTKFRKDQEAIGSPPGAELMEHVQDEEGTMYGNDGKPKIVATAGAAKDD